MTTKSGARVYRRAPKPLEDGACAHCGRVVPITPAGFRRRHLDAERRPCTGGGVAVDLAPVEIGEMPPVVLRKARAGREVCVDCGQHPRVKRDGTFEAHRVDIGGPYCPGGSARCY